LIYQIDKIKLLRQTSTSTKRKEQILQMRTLNQSAFSFVNLFWQHIPSEIGIFFEFYTEIYHVNSILRESIKENPNSSQVRELYSSFLINSATNFDESVVQYYYKLLIDEGKSFSIDYCFRSLCYSFPNYIHKKVVDIHGKIISVHQKSNSEMNHSSYTLNQEIEIDQEQQNIIEKRLFSDSKARIAFQHAIRSRSLQYSYYMDILGFIFMIICLITMIFIVIFSFSFSLKLKWL
jgi:recombinational DNA repair protein (RecF pathway)